MLSSRKILKKRFWRTIAKELFLLFVIPLIVMSCVASATDGDTATLNETIGKWEVYEVTLTTTNTYSNPYKDVSLSATFNGPKGKEIKIEGFWDGENTWEIRFVPDEIGMWTGVTESNDPELNNIEIQLEAIDKGLHGFIRTDPYHPYSLRYEDGGPHFLPIGDTGGRFVMDQDTKTAPSNWKHYFDEMASEFKANHFYTGLIDNPSWHPNGYYAWPFGGSASSPDFDRYNIEQWRHYDEVIDYAESKGIVISTSLLAWTTVPKNTDNVMTTVQKEAFYKYAMARLAHHRNVMWVLYWDIAPDQDFVRNEGNYVKSVDPYKHLLSSHQKRNSGNSYAKDAWEDIITLETLDELDGNDIKEWRKYNKPVIIAEDRYSYWRWPDHPPYFFRRLLWVSILSGGAATWGGTPNEYATTADYEENSDPECSRHGGKRDFKYIHKFFTENNISFWDMDPHDDLVSAGSKALAKLGDRIIVYLPNPGAGGPYNKNYGCGGSDHNSINVDTDKPSVTVNLSSFANMNVNVVWYDPTNGTYYDEGTVTGGGNENFTSPFIGDAVLYVTSTIFDTGGGTYPSISGMHTGTIKPTDDIAVQKMYTYSCHGTGGQSEYVRIWNATGTIAEGNWTGYGGEWHTIPFDKLVILKANESYNYTIRTGSYPQIIHKQRANVTGGTITCEEFVDANGKSYNDVIPAIKLYSAGAANASSRISDDMAHAGCDTEPPATVLCNTNNSALNRLLNVLGCIKGFYNLFFSTSNLHIT